MEKDKINVEIRSESFNEILSAPTSWVTRSGNLFLATLLFFLLGLSLVISYPDEIQGIGTVSKSTPPIEVSNLNKVQLRSILVAENQFVKEQDILAVFEERIEPKDVSIVKSYLNSLNFGKSHHTITSPKLLKLGSFTPVWLKFISSEHHTEFETTLCIDQFQKWQKSALLLAPYSGKIIFNKQLQLYKTYLPNELSIVVDPGKGPYVVYGEINTDGSSAIRKGQKALIELIDYKKNEFGILKGRVKTITQIQKNGKYEVEIELPDQLKTSYNKQIPQKPLLEARIKIITNEKRLLLRVIDGILN